APHEIHWKERGFHRPAAGARGGGPVTSGRGEIELRLDPARIALAVVIVGFGVAAVVFLRGPGGPQLPPKPGSPVSGPLASREVSDAVSALDGVEPAPSGPAGASGGAGKSTPPAAAPPAPAPLPASPTPSAAPATRAGTDGDWSVQVFAGDA